MERENKKSKSIRTSTSLRTGLLLLLRRPFLIFFSIIKMVFLSNWLYIALAAVVSSIFWIIFSVFDQLLFFSPILVFYLPDDAVLGFIISSITAVLMGMIVSMNVYVLKHSRGLKIGVGSFFSGSTLSVISSTCASCSSIGFLLVSTFGGVGVTASTFLSNYQTPLRIVSIALLVWALYSISNKLTKSCTIDKKII
ncbi:MAG: hypothetical protein WA421_19980 [Nitrososphaeraceae archaeon]